LFPRLDLLGLKIIEAIPTEIRDDLVLQNVAMPCTRIAGTIGDQILPKLAAPVFGIII
jgi:hypothetical protein